MGAWNEVLSGTETALNSTGGATERMAIYTESLEGKLKTMQSTWEEFVLNLQASDAFKSLIDLGTKLISVLDLLLNKIPFLSNIIKIGLVAGALNIAAGTIRKLITLMGRNGLIGTIINVGNTITGIQSGFAAFISTMQGGTGVISAITMALGAFDAATGAATLSMAGFVASIAPLLAIGAVVGVIGIVAYFNSAAKAAKDAEKAMSDFNKKQQELSEVQSELDQVNDKIAEINAKDGLTLTDQQELINLKKQRAELDALKKTYDSLSGEKTAAADAIGGAVNARYKTTRSFGSKKTNTGTAADLTGATAQQLHNVATIDASQHNLDQLIGGYKELKRVQEEVASDGKTLDKSRADSLDKISTGLANELTYLQQQKTDLESLGVTSGAVYDDIVGKISSIEQVVSPEAWQGKQLTNLLLGDDISQTVKDAESQIDELKQKLADGIIDEDAYKEKLIEALNKIASDPTIQEGLKNIFPDLDLSDNGAVLNTIAEALGETIPSAAEKTTYSIKDIDSGLADLDGRLDTLKNGIDNLGSFDWSGINNIDNFNEALAQGEDLVNSYENELDGLQSAYDSLGANVDAAGSALDFLAKNMDDIVNSGQAGYKATSDVINGAGQLADIVDTATGEVINVQDRIEAIMTDETLTQQQKQAAVIALQGDIQNAGNNTITTMNTVITAIVKVKQELASALNAAASFVDNASKTLGKIGNSIGGKVVSGLFGISTDDINAAVQGLSNGADTLRQKSQEITNSIKNDQADLIKQTDLYQSKLDSAAGGAAAAYKKVQDAANKAGKSGRGSTKKQTDATKKLTEALKEEYKAQKAILDAQKKQFQARKEALAKEKSDLADAKEAIQDLVDMTMKMLKQEYQNRVDILEKQIDALEEDLSDQQDKLEKAYNKQTEALENQLDAFNEKIEAQKEYLKLQKEEQEHAEELSEKNQAIADVQAQLEELRYDNSAAAQKKRLELLDELNGAQKDLTDYQNQYDYDTKVDGLDKEQSAFQQQIENEKNALKDRYDQEKQQIEDTYNAKIDALNKEKDYIKNTLMEEYNLYQEAINLIQGKSQDFYNRLIEFNRVYGSHIDSDIIIMWGKAYDALSKYGYLGNTVQEILDGISYRTEEIVKENAAIEDSIKSIENQLDALKTKYDAATAAAKQLAAANDAATQSANNLAAARANAANAGNTTTVSKPAKGSSVSSGSTRVSAHQTMAVFHEGTNYVKKANTWLDDMLGLAPNETAAILKEGEAIIPDYNNPANPSSNFSYGKMAESMSKSAGYTNNSNDNSASVSIGDIVIQGNADNGVVEKLDKIRKQIVDDVFKTMNKHTNIGGYRSVKHAY